MPAKPRSAFEDAVRAIARSLDPEILGTGPLAMLRRLDPSRASAEPALHRLLARHVEDRSADRELSTWTLLVQAMALAAPDLLRATAGLGAPLFLAGYKDGRLTRLLEAREDELAVAVPRAVRFLVARLQPFDPVALARFVHAIKAGGQRAENARTEVARDYYRAERNAAATPSPSTQDAP